MIAALRAYSKKLSIPAWTPLTAGGSHLPCAISILFPTRSCGVRRFQIAMNALRASVYRQRVGGSPTSYVESPVRRDSRVNSNIRLPAPAEPGCQLHQCRLTSLSTLAPLNTSAEVDARVRQSRRALERRQESLCEVYCQIENFRRVPLHIHWPIQSQSCPLLGRCNRKTFQTLVCRQ